MLRLVTLDLDFKLVQNKDKDLDLCKARFIFAQSGDCLERAATGDGGNKYDSNV